MDDRDLEIWIKSHPTRLRIFMIFGENNPTSASQIRRILNDTDRKSVDYSVLYRHLDNLTRNGLIKRRLNKFNRRYYIFLPKGQNIYNRIKNKEVYKK